MSEIVNIEKVYLELLALRREVQLIKNRIINIDIVMSSDEEIVLEEALEAHKNGKTKRYEDLRKELGD
ncbi:MAG: hypothetical protein AABW79_00180 [Nanoarchaeota archaeon]|mgnify:CR=1 FL=1